jgi:hypothetical protein
MSKNSEINYENDSPMCPWDFMQDCSTRCRNFLQASDFTTNAVKTFSEYFGKQISIPEFKASVRYNLTEKEAMMLRTEYRYSTEKYYPSKIEDCKNKENLGPIIRKG